VRRVLTVLLLTPAQALGPPGSYSGNVEADFVGGSVNPLAIAIGIGLLSLSFVLAARYGVRFFFALLAFIAFASVVRWLI
jgi:hypothetical protein